MKIEKFTDLKVWQKAHALVLEIYQITEKHFPKNELYGLTSQIRRASVSIPANIAEGFKKSGKMDKARFYNISQGSLEEVRYYLILAHDLGYCKTCNYSSTLDEIGKMLSGLINTVKKKKLQNNGS